MDDHDKGPTAIEKHEPPRAMSPVVAMGMRMLEKSPSPETLRELLKVQREWEENEARKAYAVALVGLKRDLPAVITKDKTVSFETRGGSATTYQQVTLAHVLDEVTEALTQHGFALSWSSTTREGRVFVTCKLMHSAGHCVETTLDAQPEQGGGKNAVQAIGSTITYLERYSALSLLGIATRDQDDADERKTDAGDPAPGLAKVDVNRNLSAVGKLKKLGKSAEEACKQVDGRTVEQWTEADLKKIEAWARSPAPTEGAT